MKNVILLSHGPLASSILESCKMIYGEHERIQSFCLMSNDSVDRFKGQVISFIEGKTEEETILVTDIPGGSPSNISLQIQSVYPHIKVISGMNLAMVLELMINLDSSTTEEIVSTAFEAAKESIAELNIQLNEEELSELDELV